MTKYNTISIFLMGGLGNRLFQIITAWSLCKKYNMNLGVINILPNFHSKNNYFENILRNFSFKVSPNRITFREPENSCLNFINIPINKFYNGLYGYFQNEKYFIENRNEILTLLKIEDKRLNYIHSIIPNIDNKYFIHIRRGDYINNPLHYIELSTFYEKSMQFIKLKDPSANFIILSNDYDYCKKINWDNCQVIDEKDEVTGLYIMSLCKKGGICANSSYSWWGGWLIDNDDKIVIFPGKWFNNNWNIDIGFKGAYICNLETYVFNMNF